MTFRTLLAIAVVGLSSGANAQSSDDLQLETETRALLVADLKDPDSVKFLNLRKIASGAVETTCGQLNAKNSYGAYVGYRPFVIADGTVFIANDDNEAIRQATLDVIEHLCREQPAAQ